MRVPFLDLKAQLATVGEAIKEAVCEVVDSTRYIGGPKVAALEQRLASYLGTRHAVGVSSGTDALLVSLMSEAVGSGDLVITPAYSFSATASVVSRVHASLVFVDIDPGTYNISTDALRDWFAENDAERVRAIIPVHLFGQCADLEPILKIADQHNITVIEDAAQAIGARCLINGEKRFAGSLGKFGCFSFYPSKNLGGLGDGGVILTDDDLCADRLKRLRNHGTGPHPTDRTIGGNFQLDAIQAAALAVKLEYLERWNAARRKNAAYYDEHLAGVRTPTVKFDRACHVYNQYVIEVPERRDALCSVFDENGIGYAIYYPAPFHLQDCFRQDGYRPGDFPQAEHAAAYSIALPIYPELTRQMQDFVIETIREIYS